MSHKDDVSVLRGNAPQLADLADPLYDAVEAGAFEELATRFSESGGKVVAATDKVKTVVGNVDGAWDGASADSFVAYMTGFGGAGLSVNDALTNAASDLQYAGIVVRDVRDALEGVFANLVTEVQELGGQAEGEELDSKINEVVERYRPQVVEQLEAANGVLTSAASALSGRADEINPKFSTMADPGTSTFVPNSGTPLEWMPTPPESPGPDGEDTPDDGTTPGGAPPGGTPPGGAPPGGTPPEGAPPGGAPPGGAPPGGAPPGGKPPGGAPPEGAPPEGAPPEGAPPEEGAPGADDIVDIARGELGFEEGPGEENKYGPNAVWCSSFATWVWKQSGVDIPTLPFSGDVYNWGAERGLAYDANNLSQARPGDVLLFGTGPENTSTSTHIGVVESVDGDQVTLIEGNSSDRVQRVPHSLSGGEFYGGVHPR